ncbi:DNA primase [Hymenobacter metallilatus]|uniref:Toprim domain-containing protein n=1 Tax=Hymenobacter metallilatus TaxID=2493666 RepID=A0A428IZ21_9BACT|nr:CHC2 zinc finger domain-containing protein [Hymenobacter metallilatus]RSK24205.1 toprim domain-containing protein [Hymenobacter metallilatus]
MPLLSPSTVQAVKNLPVDAVIGAYIDLKKKGSTLQACCPFHQEKTPSFHVTIGRGTFRCYGCHAGGDGIAFVQRLQKLDFVPAIEEIAQKHGITLQYDQSLSPEQLAAEMQRRQANKDVTAALEFAAGWYAAQELPAEFVQERGLSDEILKLATVGYAPIGPRALLDAANAAGILGPVLVAADLVHLHQKDGRNTYYDTFQNRAMLPVRDWRGTVVGFSGRNLGPAMPKGEGPPKYRNTNDKAWTKGDHLHGLDVAAPAIEQAKFAYLVEGHLDVVQMWQQGLRNTVGQQGTALAEGQIKLLKRFTTHVVLTYDHDDAGRKATEKNAALLLAAGFRVSYLVPAKKDAKGNYDYTTPNDPDAFLRGLVAEAQKPSKKRRKKGEEVVELTPEQRLQELVETWTKSRRDYVTDWATREAMASEGLNDIHALATAINGLGELVELIPDPVIRTTTYDVVCGIWPKFKKRYKLVKRKEPPAKVVSEEAMATVRSLTADQLTANHEQGFFEKKGGYWVLDGKSGREVCICAFTIDILFFVQSGRLPKYVARLKTYYGRDKVAAFTTKDFVSVAAFSEAIARLHGFIFEGDQKQFNRIKNKLFVGVREAIETHYLGWNERAGVYAWSNGLIHDGEFQACDKYGVVTLRHPVSDVDSIARLNDETQLEIDGTVAVLNHPAEVFDKVGGDTVARLVQAGKVQALTYHYLPSGGDFNMNGDDADDSASKFRHKPKGGELSLQEWAKLICTVYGDDNGRTMVAFYIASLFRSTIHKANNGYFPILFKFGMPGSGKSTAALSLMYMFGVPPHTDGIALESGSTTTGMQRFLSSICDGLVWMNEYKNTLPARTIGMLKDIAGGSGKLMGQNTSGNETRVATVRAAGIISGQDLPTQDAALFSRCIICEYDKRDHEKSKDAMRELEGHQNAGRTTLPTVDLLRHRPLVVAGYAKEEPKCTTELRKEAKQLLGTEPNSRTILNSVSLLTPVKLLLDAGVIQLPFTYKELKDSLLGKMRTTSEVQNVSDEVETYLMTVATLPPFVCKEDEHYKIQKEADGRVKLYLRTGAVQGAYQTALRQQGGNPLGISAMRAYLTKHRAYIEDVARTRFSSPSMPNPTSAIVLDYEMLRQQGIEFRMERSLQAMQITGKEGEPEPAAAPAPVNGSQNVQANQADKQDLRAKLRAQAVLRFVGGRQLRNGSAQYPVQKLLDDLNWDQVPAFTIEEFRQYANMGDVLHTPNGPRMVMERADVIYIEDFQGSF